MEDVPRTLVVKRAIAFDSARHLAVGGRYWRMTALPDRWISWCPGAVLSGLHLVRRYKPRALWSTYPIATAHLIGSTLQALTGLPWIADFRDSMTEENYPADERQRCAYQRIEAKTMRRCARAVFTTPGAVRMYADRYPAVPGKRFVVIPNGYDEESFARAETSSQRVAERSSQDPVVLVHSGVLYPSERDPRSFYSAIASLLREGKIQRDSLRVVLRASGHDEYHSKLLRQYGIHEVITLGPVLPYREALGEMARVDGLLIFQSSNCNHQIPAKLYEYFRARRPILALTDAQGDTAEVLRRAGFDSIVPLDDEQQIKRGLLEFLRVIRHRNAHVASDEEIAGHTRQARSAQLADVLNEVAG